VTTVEVGCLGWSVGWHARCWQRRSAERRFLRRHGIGVARRPRRRAIPTCGGKRVRGGCIDSQSSLLRMGDTTNIALPPFSTRPMTPDAASPNHPDEKDPTPHTYLVLAAKHGIIKLRTMSYSALSYTGSSRMSFSIHLRTGNSAGPSRTLTQDSPLQCICIDQQVVPLDITDCQLCPSTPLSDAPDSCRRRSESRCRRPLRTWSEIRNVVCRRAAIVGTMSIRPRSAAITRTPRVPVTNNPAYLAIVAARRSSMRTVAVPSSCARQMACASPVPRP
jgi:hypothetical protein